MPSIPLSTPLSFIGAFLLIAGVFLTLAGLNIIKIQQVTVMPGTKTWGVGLVILMVGAVLIFIETRQSKPELAAQEPIIKGQTAVSQSENDLLAEAQSWPVTLESTFRNDDGRWPLGDFRDSGEYATMSLSDDGKYQVRVEALEPGGIRVIYPSLDPVADFALSVEARVSEGVPENVRYGVLFLSDRANYHTFRIEDGPFYRVRYRSGNDWTNFIDHTAISDFSQQKPNRMTVISLNSRMYFYLNDQFLDVLHNLKATRGLVGLVVTVNNVGESAAVEFDNFMLRVKP